MINEKICVGCEMDQVDPQLVVMEIEVGDPPVDFSLCAYHLDQYSDEQGNIILP